jgi:hypothetical protein
MAYLSGLISLLSFDAQSRSRQTVIRP